MAMAHQSQFAKDPAELVNPQVLPYIHLMSNFPMPTKSQLDTKEITKMLLDAPGIAKNRAPFHWTRLERPANGTIRLIWSRNIQFAADGFVWTGSERSYREDVGDGLFLELYLSPAGFGPGDSYAMQSRRRFRLVSVVPPSNPNAPRPDPFLWLVHWVPADKDQCIPVHPVPHDAPVFQSMRMHGTLPMKKFMLGDESNWPQIGPPPTMHGPPRLTGPPVPQRMAYPPGPHGAVLPPGAPAPPPNRSRPSLSGPPGPHHAVLKDSDIDEEENHTGDFFDVMTPRELAIERFKMNDEWMGEILASPYALNSIVPPDLGLGFAGGLGKLTEGIFETPNTEGVVEDPEDIDRVVTAKKPYIGKLDPGLAEKFRTRVKKHLEDTKAEIAEMDRQHAKALAELKSNSLLVEAEMALRSPTADVDAIVSKVGSQLGFKAERTELIRRAHDGGYQAVIPDTVVSLQAPAAPEGALASQSTGAQGAGLSRHPSHAGSHQSSMGADNDVDMGGTAASLLDQTGRTASPATTSNNFPNPQQPISGFHSAAGTPVNANANVPPPIPSPPVIKVGTPHTAPDQGTESGDWIVVPKDGASPDPSSLSNPSNPSSISHPSNILNSPSNPSNSSGLSAAAAPPIATQSMVKPVTTAPLTATVPGGSSLAFDAENTDFGSLEDLDSAGEALAGFGGDLDMDDSAFGDAFHASASDTPAADGHASDI